MKVIGVKFFKKDLNDCDATVLEAWARYSSSTEYQYFDSLNYKVGDLVIIPNGISTDVSKVNMGIVSNDMITGNVKAKKPVLYRSTVKDLQQPYKELKSYRVKEQKRVSLISKLKYMEEQRSVTERFKQLAKDSPEAAEMLKELGDLENDLH